MLRTVSMSMLFAVVAVIASVPQVQGGTITVPDYSFENVDASASPYYKFIPHSPDASKHWMAGGDNLEQATGIWLYKDAYLGFTNVDGNQIGGLTGAYGPAWIGQVLSTTYQAGVTYSLTGAMGRNTTDENVNAYVELAYLDGSTVTPIGGTALNQFAKDTLSYGTKPASEAMVDESAVASVSTGDAWNGKQIVIRFGITGQTTAGTDRIFVDNVRLMSTPEPCSGALAVVGLVGLLAYAWRKRK
jgi:hypothetical protein